MFGQQFRYLECRKGGSHYGKLLDSICLQPKCMMKSVICSICRDEEHRDHQIRPLKVTISNAKSYLKGLKPLTLDAEYFKTFITESKSNLMFSFNEFEQYVKESLETIRNDIEAIFIKMADQIELKTGKNDKLLAAIEDIKYKEPEYDVFISLMQKLQAGVPFDPEAEGPEVNASDVISAVSAIQAKVEKSFNTTETHIRAQIDKILTSLQKTAENPAIFDNTKIDFKFSTELKHTGINVISEKIIKSNEGYSYNFSLLQPSLQEKGNRPCKVAFRIKQNQSNWLAIGACHKDMISDNGYKFNYTIPNHGAYLVSSNGGSWSTIDSAKNNTLNAFSINTGDVITIEYDPVESKLVFRKKGTEDSHTIEFEYREDELYLCGLFYYNEDEIEFLGYDIE